MTQPDSPRRVLSDTSGLTQLGAPTKGPTRQLESFPFRHAGRDTVVTFRCSEFTCFCPLTGQPDYAALEIAYIPAARAIESKSLRNYLWSYRDTGVFHEDLANILLDELFDFVQPKWMKVTARFNVRGGIAIDVEVERSAPTQG
ncbi:MAG: preQ(1) synthase [Candidatus Sumerlaeia bacterium]|nr:preQ(1) synthase [Candidatus Sumerlaeia bacterium]